MGRSDPNREEAHRCAVRSHSLVQLANHYREQAEIWLKTSDDDLKKVAQDLLEAACSPFDKVDHAEQALQIGEMLDVVGWYHTLIPTKVSRVVDGYLESRSASERLQEFRLEDANATAKLVLVSIERSAAAWLSLRESLPAADDEILPVLATLDRLQRGLNALLPGARAFRRPGFEAPVD